MNPYTTLMASALLALCSAAAMAGDICENTAKLQKQSAAFELKEELKVNIAVCLNLSDPVEMAECLLEIREEYEEGEQLALDQYEARLDLCKKLGGGAYDPEIDPACFSTVIDNPFLPFPVGAHWLYESETDEGLEVIDVTVLSDTREILGVPTVGTTYRQEWLLGDAEDAATVVGDDETVVIDAGTFLHCVATEDFLLPEPDALEFKYFAPGTGFIYESKDDSDETVELISYSGV